MFYCALGSLRFEGLGSSLLGVSVIALRRMCEQLFCVISFI
jgi:hypothetical protein